jgi:hypothetical protein
MAAPPPYDSEADRTGALAGFLTTTTTSEHSALSYLPPVSRTPQATGTASSRRRSSPSGDPPIQMMIFGLIE